VRKVETELLVVGAGPAGSSAAAWAARSGIQTTIIDKEEFPRDKPCGDGLTPRAIKELTSLGLAEWLSTKPKNIGLRAAGFGQELLLPWKSPSLPEWGSSVPRTELDNRILEVAKQSGATVHDGVAAEDVELQNGAINTVITKSGDETVHYVAKNVIIADGVRSQLGRKLNRVWHRDTAYGVAARAYIKSERHDDPWISSHLELRGSKNEVLSGYGWIFPQGNGEVNIGVGTLATQKRPADINLRALMSQYTEEQREHWKLSGELRLPWSAMLPMGGAVSGVGGKNYMFIGDAAGCVNPLNGEGIDYGLETGRMAVDLINTESNFEDAWPNLLQNQYGVAFSIARRLAGYLTIPGLLPTLGPIGMRSRTLMKVALRVMGNLVTQEDQDLTARLWRSAGALSVRADHRPPFS
jgi:geranylgeranyl reductase family protein